MSPTVFFVPGLWEGPSVFNRVSSLLSKDGIKSESATLRSTGTISPGNPSMHDDILGIRADLEPTMARGEDVVLVLHSAGGFLGSAAFEGLAAKFRRERGEKGGVIGIVFITAGILDVGQSHPPMAAFTVIDGGAMYCRNAETALFGDLPESERPALLASLKPQPAENWDAGTLSYYGWKDVPSVYLICENDSVVPLPVQEHLAALAGSQIERCNSGHVPLLSQPERVVEVIKCAIKQFSS